MRIRVATDADAAFIAETENDDELKRFVGGATDIGNNSNNTTGIPLQLFNPALFSGSPIALQNFGPAVGDADRLSYGGGFVYLAERDIDHGRSLRNCERVQPDHARAAEAGIGDFAECYPRIIHGARFDLW